jgi:hypothetical protein
MKKQMISLLVLIGIATQIAKAQAPNPAPNKEEMKKLSAWVGRWKGEGSMQMGPGEPKKSSVDEKIEMKLDGTIMVVEGIGKTVDLTTKQETVVHNAFGIISYDVASKAYKFKTFTKDARSADAYFTIVSENKYEWGFDIPQGGKTRYIITLDMARKTWNEIGEYSRDGANWMKFFEMNLTKVE